MSDPSKPNRARRNLIIASACAGGAAAVGTAVPFAASMLPSERAEALGAPVEADVSLLAPGAKMTVEWRGQPVWIVVGVAKLGVVDLEPSYLLNVLKPLDSFLKRCQS